MYLMVYGLTWFGIFSSCIVHGSTIIIKYIVNTSVTHIMHIFSPFCCISIKNILCLSGSEKERKKCEMASILIWLKSLKCTSRHNYDFWTRKKNLPRRSSRQRCLWTRQAESRCVVWTTAVCLSCDPYARLVTTLVWQGSEPSTPS